VIRWPLIGRGGGCGRDHDLADGYSVWRRPKGAVFGFCIFCPVVVSPWKTCSASWFLRVWLPYAGGAGVYIPVRGVLMAEAALKGGWFAVIHEPEELLGGLCVGLRENG